MAVQEVHRKARLAWLSLRIASLRFSMSQEAGPTDNWERLARAQAGLIRQRNELRTPEEIHRIEKRRGLA